MKHTRRGGDDLQALVREALRRATGSQEPDMTRLVAAVPDLMAEARHRASAQTDLAVQAWRALPRLAAATAVVLVLSAAAVLVERASAGSSAAGFDALILSWEDSGGATDVLLEAVLAADENHG